MRLQTISKILAREEKLALGSMTKQKPIPEEDALPPRREKEKEKAKGRDQTVLKNQAALTEEENHHPERRMYQCVVSMSMVNALKEKNAITSIHLFAGMSKQEHVKMVQNAIFCTLKLRRRQKQRMKKQKRTRQTKRKPRPSQKAKRN